MKFIIASEEFTGGDIRAKRRHFVCYVGESEILGRRPSLAELPTKAQTRTAVSGPVNVWYSSPEAVWTTEQPTRPMAHGTGAGRMMTLMLATQLSFQREQHQHGAGGAYPTPLKAITLTSPGAGATITIAADAPDWANGVIRNTGGATIDNFTFVQIAGTGQHNLSLACTTTDGWRITRCTYTGADGNGYFVYFSTYGLIDNCTITGGSGSDEWILVADHDAWQTASQKGTANAVFVEDCTLSAKGYLGRQRQRKCCGSFLHDGLAVAQSNWMDMADATNSPPRSFRLLEC